MDKIICLDIYDCIFPNDNTYVGRVEDSLWFYYKC